LRQIDRTGIRHAFTALALGTLVRAGGSARADADYTGSCDGAKPDRTSFQISVSGMCSAKGNITITIYPDEADHFLDGKYKLARQ
jgi:hypothetical protein